MKTRSSEILKRPYWSTVRSLYKSMGYSDRDLDRPLIGIANSFNRVTPGHNNLNSVCEQVKQGILQAGGTPVEFGMIAPCDGIANGHEGMRYILPARELIANDIEIMIEAHRLDAVVLLGSCDKIVPGMLMAAARLDVPAILVVGGPMLGGVQFDGRSSDNSSLAEAVGMLNDGKISSEEFARLEEDATPCVGSCSFLGTANTMGAVAEAMGMCMPGTSTIPAVMAARLRAAQDSGHAVMNLVRQGITARRIISEKGLRNAIRLGMAIGGSTNMALHFPAIAREAGVELTLADLDLLSAGTPHLARIYPAGACNVPDFHNAGGVQAVLKQLEPLLDLDATICTGKTLGESLAGVPRITNAVIRSLDNPWHSSGSLAVLSGNLAPRGGVTKPIAIDPALHLYSGPAVCFDSEEEATEALLSGGIKAGDVVVIRYEGPKGGPGMREMARFMKMVHGKQLDSQVAVVTDGRFSGTNNGCFVGHVSPEASEGGPIALIEPGDIISIDIARRSLSVAVSPEELESRRKQWKRPNPRPMTRYLALYGALASSADRGAVMEPGI
ncbi:MAG TPA: dihydroxy-acid dehydratase [Spirochaetia bacterium]|nr:dihydroxy-acid dehydratase [Spirochaetia bacterium]